VDHPRVQGRALCVRADAAAAIIGAALRTT
jgi:hypothetical protein